MWPDVGIKVEHFALNLNVKLTANSVRADIEKECKLTESLPKYIFHNVTNER